MEIISGLTTHKAQRKPVQGTPVYTAVFAGHSDPRRYGNQYRTVLPYKPYYTVTVRSPSICQGGTENLKNTRGLQGL